MYLTKTPDILKPLARDLVWSVRTSQKEVFLTFDDGPTPHVTDEVLDLLKTYNARATFFCLGKNVQTSPDLYQQILASGHRTGHHTWDHPDGWKTGITSYLKNVMQAHQLIDSRLFRPPYGRITPAQVKALKTRFDIIMWDVLSADFDASNTSEKCFRNVRNNAKSGSIIVFHDNLKSKNNMIPSLKMSLHYFREEGYTLHALPFK
jgi:peptidoglycan/xylan/chitin deacetylase (PgdA/CDA1 family)